jgi:hypothetical protein
MYFFLLFLIGEFIATVICLFLESFGTFSTHFADQLVFSSALILFLLTQSIMRHLKEQKKQSPIHPEMTNNVRFKPQESGKPNFFSLSIYQYTNLSRFQIWNLFCVVRFQMLSLCSELLDLVDLIEDAMGSLIFCTCFSLLPYYSIKITQVPSRLDVYISK